MPQWMKIIIVVVLTKVQKNLNTCETWYSGPFVKEKVTKPCDCSVSSVGQIGKKQKNG